MPDGFLILDKATGVSSARALNQVKWLLPRGTKIGHAGTLDPLASGVLVAMIGRCTKLCERVMGQPKRYEATIQLGATSETDDAEGPITPVRVTDYPTRAKLNEVLNRFTGTIEQLPPTFSAMKIGGRRACDRVRAGEVVELKPRHVRVDGIRIVHDFELELGLVIDCGRGTYVRSLARDIGAALGIGGYLLTLRRTRVGPFGIERAATIEQLKERGIDAFLLPASTVDEIASA